jgi:hypothetical protein
MRPAPLLPPHLGELPALSQDAPGDPLTDPLEEHRSGAPGIVERCFGGGSTPSGAMGSSGTAQTLADAYTRFDGSSTCLRPIETLSAPLFVVIYAYV